MLGPHLGKGLPRARRDASPEVREEGNTCGTEAAPGQGAGILAGQGQLLRGRKLDSGGRWTANKAHNRHLKDQPSHDGHRWVEICRERKPKEPVMWSWYWAMDKSWASLLGV